MPVDLPDLADLLNIGTVKWGVQRNDEMSGSGDSRIWQVEHSSPLWTAEVGLTLGHHDEIKQIAARIRKLHGAQGTFMLFDPLSKYPQSDPKGVNLGAATVEIGSIGVDNQSLALNGLPADYVLTVGDKGQVTDDDLNFFFEFSDDVTANGSGVTTEVQIFPHCPPWLEADMEVNLVKPACKMFIMPDSHDPGEARNVITTGATFTAMERRR